jgi:aminoglycoside phosphotransferase (APT) family kinase protein
MVPEGSIEVGDIIKEKFDWLYLSKEAIPEENFTISHFDYRADNMFFDDKNEEQPVIMIDLGNAVITGGILDVAYLLAFSIPIELRRKIEKEMVQVYIDRLLERGAKLTDLSFDRAWTFYCRCLMSNLFLLVLAFVNGDLSSERSKKLIEVGLKRCFAAIIENEVIKALPP